METQYEENLTNNRLYLPGHEIADLAINDEQADQTKGGLLLNFTKVELRQIPMSPTNS